MTIFTSLRATAPASFLLAALLIAGPVLAQETDLNKVVFTVGDQNVTERDMLVAEQDFADVLKEMPAQERRVRLTQILTDMFIVAKEAENLGLDKTENYEARVRLLKATALRNIYFDEKVMKMITDVDVQKRYQEEIAKLSPDEMISARHILVKEEAEAIKIIEELNAGADFAELAKTKSTGPSGPSGGELGQFRKGQMVPAFEAAAFALEVNGVTQTPVQTQFGWHVIQTTEKTTAPAPAFDQVKDQVRQLLVTERFTAELEKLRAANH